MSENYLIALMVLVAVFLLIKGIFKTAGFVLKSLLLLLVLAGLCYVFGLDFQKVF